MKSDAKELLKEVMLSSKCSSLNIIILSAGLFNWVVPCRKSSSSN